MNKSFIKFATDFGPLLAFFIIYYKNDKDLVSAIPALIIATLIAICVIYMLEKRIPINAEGKPAITISIAFRNT